MATRASTRLSRARVNKREALEESNSQGIPAPCSKRPAAEQAAGALPLLDDETAGIVMSYLPSACLGDSALISKAWECLSSKDCLWRPFLSKVDPMSALGEDRLREMSLQYSCKQVKPLAMAFKPVDLLTDGRCSPDLLGDNFDRAREVVSELSTRLCSCCREPTNGFFVLTGRRLCVSCFETDPSVKMSSLSYARSHYLLSKSQEKRLPTMRVEKAKETGLVFTDGVTLTLVSAAKASAVDRWGSEEAFQAEMDARKARAEASFETRKQAAKDQAHGPADASPGSITSNVASSGQQAQQKPRRAPSCPRILGLDKQINYVGANQKKDYGVRGEKYGFFTVVNDAYFDSGPTVVISEDDPESYRDQTCGFESCDGCERCEEGLAIYRAMERKAGAKLADELRTAKHGTTIEIAARCSTPIDGHIVTKSVRLIGKGDHHVRVWNAPLVIISPSIVRGLEVLHSLAPMTTEEFEDFAESALVEDTIHPSVTLLDDSLLEKCSIIGQHFSRGVRVRLGRLVAIRNTFHRLLWGVDVSSYTCSVTTTAHFVGNIFSDSDCGIQKGTARCHPAEENAEILAANNFHGIRMEDRVREEHDEG